MAKFIAAAFFVIVGLAMVVVPLIGAGMLSAAPADVQHGVNKVILAGVAVIVFGIWLGAS